MMKLKNKGTGEIVSLQGELTYDDKVRLLTHYNSLAELTEEWEDYEESVKPYWFINDLDGEPMKCDLKKCRKSNFTEWSEHRKEIGNYFSSIEEAEKAVEKLKAWKRLRDNGFRFTAYQLQELNIKFFLDHGYTKMGDDLDLLFNTEEG